MLGVGPLVELFGKELLNNRGGTVNVDDMEAEVIGVYFSASWCPPCRAFTPQLVEHYKKMKDSMKSYEIVFVSRDHSDAEFLSYFGKMPWLAIGYMYADRRNRLASAFGVRSIPSLIFINRKGAVVNANGRNELHNNAFFDGIPNLGDDQIEGFTVEICINNICENTNLKKDEKHKLYRLIEKILFNLINFPGEDKYITLRLSNPKIQELQADANFIRILKLAGFRESNDKLTCSKYPNLSLLNDIHNHVKMVADSLQQ